MLDDDLFTLANQGGAKVFLFRNAAPPLNHVLQTQLLDDLRQNPGIGAADADIAHVTEAFPGLYLAGIVPKAKTGRR